ncbi:hypothetical protein A6485_14510 [Listeria monocytogenes]|nr:hypothetical protein [Listeria monocytogenes]
MLVAGKRKNRQTVFLERNNTVLLYSGTFILLGLLVFFLVSKLILPDDSPVLATSLNTFEPLGDTDYKIESWKYNPKQNFMEVRLTISEESETIAPNLKYEAREKTQVDQGVKSTLKAKLVYQDARNIVVVISHIPTKWEAVNLTLSNKQIFLPSADFITDPSDEEDNVASDTTSDEEDNRLSLYADYRTIHKDNNLQIQSDIGYQVLVAKTNKAYQLKLLEELKKYIQNEKDRRIQLTKEIHILKEELPSQTLLDQQDTRDLIKQKQGEIVDSTQQEKEYFKQQKLIEEKVAKLDELITKHQSDVK